MAWRVMLLLLAPLLLLALEGWWLPVIKEVGSSGLVVLLQRKGAVEREHG